MYYLLIMLNIIVLISKIGHCSVPICVLIPSFFFKKYPKQWHTENILSIPNINYAEILSLEAHVLEVW